MQEISRQFDEAGFTREVRDRLMGYESPELTRAFTARRKAAEKELEEGKIKSLRITEARRIGRNDPCPCSSGLKFKKCCGVNFRDDDDRLKD